jgi:hypothetical protein
LAEQWRHWEAPLSVEPVPDQGLYLPDGRILGETQIVWSEDEIERFRAGYKCVNCLEPQEQSWPENCPLCGYPMRTEQASFFARQFAGEVLLGRQTSLADELEGLEERRRKEDERRARENAQLGR